MNPRLPDTNLVWKASNPFTAKVGWTSVLQESYPHRRIGSDDHATHFWTRPFTKDYNAVRL